MSRQRLTNLPLNRTGGSRSGDASSPKVPAPRLVDSLSVGAACSCEIAPPRGGTDKSLARFSPPESNSACGK